MELKNRPCPECQMLMEPRFISMNFTNKNSDIQVEVVGIPANVCPNCSFRLIPSKIAKYLDKLLAPIFESDWQKKEQILPMPHFTIWFPQPKLSEIRE